jgi:hypothetical protein
MCPFKVVQHEAKDSDIIASEAWQSPLPSTKVASAGEASRSNDRIKVRFFSMLRMIRGKRLAMTA